MVFVGNGSALFSICLFSELLLEVRDCLYSQIFPLLVLYFLNLKNAFILYICVRWMYRSEEWVFSLHHMGPVVRSPQGYFDVSPLSIT